MARIGELHKRSMTWAAAVVAGMALSCAASAAEVKFDARVDRTQLGLDDSLALKFTVEAEGSVSTEPPTFNAPDFTVINSFDNNFVESYYDSTTGRFGMRNRQQLTKVLKPNRPGTFKITRLGVRANGKALTAPDITVQVLPAGSGTPPPRNYGGGGVGLRGASKRVPNTKIFVRAEIDKDKAYKGEQIVVSYYLYRRVRTMNLQISKYPTLSGFLREELEMPTTQGGRLDTETVVLDGVPYQRSLLLRYAAYPLQEGKLKIDSLDLKYTYFADPGMSDDGEDPFMNFFRQLTPIDSNASSESLTVDVLPLPIQGRPASFSGGVGDFSVTSAVDRTEVRANEAVTLTVKVEGRGNVAAIGEPKVQWPSGVELYDSKGTARSSRGGVGEKVFDILLIPRKPGPMTLPGVEFSFFDPVKKEYVSRTTQPVQINVLETAPGTTPSQPSAPAVRDQQEPSSSGSSKPAPLSSAPKGLKAPESVTISWMDFPFWRVMYILAALSVSAFLLMVGIDLIKKLAERSRENRETQIKNRSRSWSKLHSSALEAVQGSPWSEVSNAYETLNEVILDALDRGYRIGARSLPRAEIQRILTEQHGWEQSRWKPIGQILENAEAVRFGGVAGSAFQQQARVDLGRWVKEAEALIQSLDSK